MLVNLLANLLGVLVFLFIFWKRLREDYSSEIIFKTALYILTGIFLGSALFQKISPGWFFWGSFVGAVVGLGIAIYAQKVKFYETLEAFIISSLPWLSFVFLKDSVLNSSLSSFLGFIVILLMLFVSYYLDTHYKNFTWYRSGRIGFAGLAVAGLIFITRAGIAISQIRVLSFGGRYEAIFSLTVASFCFLLLYILGRGVKK